MPSATCDGLARDCLCATPLTRSDLGIKQEPNILDGLDLELALQAATKRPFEDMTNGDDPSKRVKTEDETTHDNDFENDHGAEESLEDGLALLVQNALSNVGDLVNQFTQDADMAHTTSDPMDVDSVPGPDDSLPPISVTFLSDPQKYLRNASRNALGNLVGWNHLATTTSERLPRRTGHLDYPRLLPIL